MTQTYESDSTDAAEYHENPVRHIPDWTRSGISNGKGNILWADYLLCWCGRTRPLEVANA